MWTLRHCLEFFPWCRGHFGTSAEMSWVRSALGPKCPYTRLPRSVVAYSAEVVHHVVLITDTVGSYESLSVVSKPHPVVPFLYVATYL